MKGGVRKRKNTWYYYFDLGIVDGKRKKIERSAEGAQTKAEAEAVLRRRILEYENAGTVFKPTEMTLHDFLMFWQEEYVELRLKPNTQDNYRLTIKNHILPHLGKYKLKSLTPHVLQQYMNMKVREGLARQTLSIIRGILNKALNQAVYPYKYISENPMLYVELMKDKDRKPTKEDLKIQSKENLRLLNQRITEDHPFYLPFHIGLHCGLRVGELCGLEWKHVNFDEMTIEIEQQLTKRKIEGKDIWVVSSPKSVSGYRTIPVGNALMSILKKAKMNQKENKLKYGEFYRQDPEHDFVCKKENGLHYTPSVIKYQTRELIKGKLGIEFNYHSLRHTHATMLIENGTPIKTVQKRLGHSRSAVTEDRYVHLTEKMARDAADIFDSLAQDL
ncbi:tyrosine-type recombinase/integrase [Lysinibacillus odysseyi]|uniref:Integrase n=1 Tax=Lysinibacillus odysseyi 34hs-1 = NBRC 100172 TaxID=1220589 RepID=A0A0A3IJ51_9BACI|nr:site-specific integrase [Lysinibacillus odysseyi]KGR83510.1 integrase [Lysinibacillus odysseyi 34hs-1 = NBRC 100172]